MAAGVLEEERGRERAAEARGEVRQQLGAAVPEEGQGLVPGDLPLADGARQHRTAVLGDALLPTLLDLLLGEIDLRQLARAGEELRRLDDRALVAVLAGRQGLRIDVVFGLIAGGLLVVARRGHRELPFVAIDFHDAAIGAATARREAVDLAGLAVAQQGAHRALVDVAPRGVLPEPQRAVLLPGRVLAAAVEPRHLDDLSATGGASTEHGLGVIEFRVVEGLGAFDDLHRVVPDLRHEVLQAAVPALHLAEVVLDLTGQLGGGETIHVDLPQRVDHADALHGGAQRLAETHRVALADQVLDGVRPGRGRPDALFGDGRREVVVLHLLAGVLHQREQPRFADPRQRLGLLLEGFDLQVPHRYVPRLALPLAQSGQTRLFVTVARQHRAPTRLHQGTCTRAEMSLADPGDALHALPAGGWVKGTEEAPRHQVEEALVVAAELALRQVAGGNDREVVGDPLVIEDARGILEPMVEQVRRRPRIVREFPAAARGILRGAAPKCAQGLGHRVLVVTGQAAGIGTWVGEDLVTVVAALGGGKRAPRGPREAPVRLALQAGEIEERRRRLPGGLAALLGDSLLAANRRDDAGGAVAVEEAVVLAGGLVIGLEGRIEPVTRIGPPGMLEVRLDPPVGLGYVREHLEFAVHQHGERGGLDAPRRPGGLLLAGLQALGERAGGVHPDQPVRAGAAARGVGETLELVPGPQVVEALPDRAVGHGSQPQAQDRLIALQIVDDLAEDQLALATGVAGVDDAIHVLALQESADGPDALTLALLGLVAEGLGQDRQDFQRPGLELLIHLLGGQQFEEVPDREGDHVVVVLKIAVVVREPVEDLGDVPGHARLFSDDQRLGQLTTSSLGGQRSDPTL